MNTTLVRTRQIKESLSDKEYRDLFVAANIRNGIAFQIRAMREARAWTQGELGVKLGVSQEQVSQLENPNKGSLSIRTLTKLASAFDVALLVRFVPFSELVSRLVGLGSENLNVPSFGDERVEQRSFLIALPPSDASLGIPSNVTTYEVHATPPRIGEQFRVTRPEPTVIPFPNYRLACAGGIK